MPIQPGTSPLSFLLSRRGIGPAVSPGQLPGTATPPSADGQSSPNPIAALLASALGGGGQPQAPGQPPGQPQVPGQAPGQNPGMAPSLFNQLMSQRLGADPRYMRNILKQSKLAFAHLIPYAAQTQGTDVSKDLASIYKQLDTVIDKVEKNIQPISQPAPIGMAAAQSAGGMNANITPVNSLPVSGVLPSGQY